MNAYLMAAGNGMRLRPLTEDVQKCMLPVGGKPMLEWWLDAAFYSQSFKNVFVNLHHCAEKVETWIWQYNEVRDKNVQMIDERSGLLGTAGTLFWHADTDEDLMVAYTDTYSAGIFQKLHLAVKKFKSLPTDCIAGLVTFDSPEDRSAGIIDLDDEGRVIRFVEKSDVGKMAWAGVMFARREFFSFLREDDKDLSRDVFPRLLGRMAVVMHVGAYDMGRGIEYYEQLNRKIQKAR